MRLRLRHYPPLLNKSGEYIHSQATDECPLCVVNHWAPKEIMKSITFLQNIFSLRTTLKCKTTLKLILNES